MFTHHSHSGEFCQHAEGSLESMILKAIELGFEHMCLTEHIPRLEMDQLYPEEIASNTTPEALVKTFDSYYKTARDLQEKYKSQIDILVGLESESISDKYFQYFQSILNVNYKFDVIIGSVHHVATIPIDYGEDLWTDMSSLLDDDLNAVLNTYFDLQFENMQSLKPTVIAHFDLIRLCAPKNLIPDDLQQFPDVWQKIIRNINYAKSIGAMIEINTAAIRKGWDTPYPKRDITKLAKDLGAEFCLSDDSHKTEQVGLNYRPAIEYLESMGIDKLSYLTSQGKKTINIEEFKAKPLYNKTPTTA